jgi:hypothetical protein
MEVLQKHAEGKAGEWKTADWRRPAETVSRGLVPYVGEGKMDTPIAV